MADFNADHVTTAGAGGRPRKDFFERYASVLTMALTIVGAAIVLYGNQREIIAEMRAQREAFLTYAQSTDKRLDRMEIVIFPPLRPGPK